MFFLVLVVLFIHLDCFGERCQVLETSAVEMSEIFRGKMCVFHFGVNCPFKFNINLPAKSLSVHGVDLSLM